jgi:hypothetical protein
MGRKECVVTLKQRFLFAVNEGKSHQWGKERILASKSPEDTVPDLVCKGVLSLPMRKAAAWMTLMMSVERQKKMREGAGGLFEYDVGFQRSCNFVSRDR